MFELALEGEIPIFLSGQIQHVCLVSKGRSGEPEATVKGMGDRGGPHEALPLLAMPGQGVNAPGLSYRKKQEANHIPPALQGQAAAGPHTARTSIQVDLVEADVWWSRL